MATNSIVGRRPQWSYRWLVLFAAICSSCFSPDRQEVLACSAQGLCPGLLVCDYDQVCRDSYSIDGGLAIADGSSGLIDGTIDAQFLDAEIPDAAFLPQTISPAGPTVNTALLGLSIGTMFDPVLCPDGEVMVGYEGSNFNNGSAAGLCRIRAQCGHLETSESGVVVVVDGATVPLIGLGAVDCAEIKIDGVTSVTCPTNSVVSGLSGVRSGPSFAIAVTSISLHCAEVSLTGVPLASMQTVSSGSIYSVSIPEETVTCPEGSVATGFGGLATVFAIGHEFTCRFLEVDTP